MTSCTSATIIHAAGKTGRLWGCSEDKDGIPTLMTHREDCNWRSVDTSPGVTEHAALKVNQSIDKEVPPRDPGTRGTANPPHRSGRGRRASGFPSTSYPMCSSALYHSSGTSPTAHAEPHQVLPDGITTELGAKRTKAMPKEPTSMQ